MNITVIGNVTLLAYRRFTHANVNCFKGFFTLAFVEKRESQSDCLQRRKTSQLLYKDTHTNILCMQ